MRPLSVDSTNSCEPVERRGLTSSGIISIGHDEPKLRGNDHVPHHPTRVSQVLGGGGGRGDYDRLERLPRPRRQRAHPPRLHRPGQSRRSGARRLPGAQGLRGRRHLRHLSALPRFRGQEDRRTARHSSTITASCSTARTSTPSSSTRPTTGTPCKRSTPARRARTSTSRSRCRCAWPRAARWSRRPRSTTASCRSAFSGARRRWAGRSPTLIASGGIGKVTVARAFHIQNEWPKGIGNPARRASRPRTSTGTPGSGRPRQALQQEPHLLPLPLVLRLLRRPAHQLRRPLPRVDPLGAGPDGPAGRRRHGRQVRRLRQPRSPRHARSACGTIPATRWSPSRNTTPRRPRRRPGPARSNSAAPRGRCTSICTATRSSRTSILANEFPARTPVDRAIERGYRVGGKPLIEPKKVKGEVLDADHARNFLDCVKSRRQPSCDIEFGHRATTAPLIGNIAHRTKSYLEWDAATERFTNNDAANKLLSYEYREPYHLPG